MISIFKSYLSFRAKQIVRVVRELGLGHAILLSPIIYIGILGVLHTVMVSQGFLLAIALLASLIGIHWTRKDRFFLEQLAIPIQLFYLVDYCLLYSPILCCFIFWGKWQNLLGYLFGVLIFAFIKPSYNEKGIKQKIAQFNTMSWIPLELFEWRAGFRQYLKYIAGGYVLSLALGFYPITIFIALFLGAMLITTFFKFYENKDLLLAVNHNQKILPLKVFTSLKLFNLLLLPHYCLFLIFNHSIQHIGALIIGIIIAQMIIAFSICMKYKNYRFDHHKVYNTFPLAFFVACWTYPYLWPVPIIMLIHFWRAAQKNLIHHYA